MNLESLPLAGIALALASAAALSIGNLLQARGMRRTEARMDAGADGSRQPSEKELSLARFQGKHVAGIAAKLK